MSITRFFKLSTCLFSTKEVQDYVTQKSLKNDVKKKKPKEDTVLNRQAFWSKERDSATTKWVLTCQFFCLFGFASSQRGTTSWADSRTLWAALVKKEKEDLMQEYFRRALLKQRPFYLPLNLAQSPPKGNRAPTVRSVYFLLSWKAKVLLPLRGVTSIHQRKK